MNRARAVSNMWTWLRLLHLNPLKLITVIALVGAACASATGLGAAAPAKDASSAHAAKVNRKAKTPVRCVAAPVAGQVESKGKKAQAVSREKCPKLPPPSKVTSSSVSRAAAPAASLIANDAKPTDKISLSPIKTATVAPLPLSGQPRAPLESQDQSAALKALPSEALNRHGALHLPYLLNVVLQAHPSLKAVRMDKLAASEDLRAAERQRWPAVSAIVENKSNNASVVSTRVLRVEKTLWDAGRVTARIDEAGTNVTINESRVAIISQQLALQVVNTWQNLTAADARIAVANGTLDQLNRYRQQMERRVQAEASSLIDLELVSSRILQTQVELNQAQTARKLSLSRLEILSGVEGLVGLPWRAPSLPGLQQTEMQARVVVEMNWRDVAMRHPNVEKARQDAVAARQRIEGKRAEQYPQLYLRMDQPVDAANNAPVSFLGLRYTPGAGFATGLEAQALANRAASLDEAVEAALRDVTEALLADRDEFFSSRNRLAVLDKAVEGSRAVLESYGRQFVAGRKTWQDLLNAVRELAQNQYTLAESHAAMLAALYRLQVRMGDSIQPTL